MKVNVNTRWNDEPSKEKKKRKRDDLKESTAGIFHESIKKSTKSKEDPRKKSSVHNKSKNSEKPCSLADSHYEIFEDNNGYHRKKLKLGKLDLLNSLREDEETYDVPYYDPPVKQKPVHKRIENLTPEQDERIRQIYKEQNKKMRNGPMMEIREDGKQASLDLDDEVRYPIIFSDIEDILNHVQSNLQYTRWLHIKRPSKLHNTIMLSVEGPSLEDYQPQIEDCPSLQSYKVSVEFVSPMSYGDCVERCFASNLDIKPPSDINIKEDFQNMKSCPKKDGFIVGLDTLFNIKWNIKELETNKRKKQTDSIVEEKEYKIAKDVIEVEIPEKNDHSELSDAEIKDSYKHCFITKQVLPISLFKRDTFSRLDLIMTPREMASEKYPLPFISRFLSFVKTKDEYHEVTEKSPMFGLDCEMCETIQGSELTRISIVNEKHEVVYEKLVKPHNKIVNYLTKYSGITAKMMQFVTTRLSDVQAELKILLPPDAILVGQSLNCDLIAMKMMHPYVIDTSVIFNLSGIRQCKAKLKTLCAEFLSERIQICSKKGHNSLEDALAALKLVQAKLKHTLNWGDAVLGYKRTEEESRIANLELLKKDKECRNVKTRLRLAFNALVDDSSLYEGPKHQHLIKHNKQRAQSSDLETSKNKIEEMRNELYGDEDYKDTSSKKNTLNGIDNTVIDVKKPEHANPTPTKHIYSEVAIVGSREVINLYKLYLPEGALERVKFFKAKTSKEIISKVLELDAQNDKKRLIMAHLKSPCVCQVEKWSSKLKSDVKDNDLVCISLCGSKDVFRGAFFATLPSVDRSPTTKQVVRQYLESCGHKYEDTTESTSDN